MSKAKKQTIILHLPSLVGVMKFASNDNTRMYLKSVYIHWKDGATAYVATDGHRLCLGQPHSNHVKSSEGVFGKPTENHDGVILHIDDVKEVARFWDKKTFLAIGCMALMEVDGNKVAVSSWDKKHIINTKGIDATYPEYERVIPPEDKKTVEPTEFGLNMSYLEDLKHAGKIFSHPRSMSASVLFYGPEHPVKFKMKNPDGDKATCVIMPMRL